MWRGVLRLRSLVPARGTATHVPSRLSGQVASHRRSLCTRQSPEPQLKTTHTALPTGAPDVASSAYKLQGRIPTAADKKVLLWSGRFKQEQDIPEMVSIEMLYAARNKIRVKICYLMIGVSVLACLVMVISGKKAFKNKENLTKWNLDKKAKLKEQFEQERETLAGKAQ
uniref:protein FAM162B-like n=1 Tax=Pristiophorus japonicus TaxID=55135 RepID=UPI00398E5AC7